MIIHERNLQIESIDHRSIIFLNISGACVDFFQGLRGPEQCLLFSKNKMPRNASVETLRRKFLTIEI